MVRQAKSAYRRINQAGRDRLDLRGDPPELFLQFGVAGLAPLIRKRLARKGIRASQ
jgi:hypothetical protein